MRSHPYHGISDRVRHVVRDVLDGADDYHQAHKARLTRTVDLLYKEAPSGKLLELGTSGFIPLICKELLPGLEVHGTHFSKGENASETFSFTVGRRTVETLCYTHDLEYGTFPVKDETYDFVLCCEVIEHMEIDPMFMLSEVNRVLKTGGTILVTTPNITSSRAISKILSGVEPHFFMQYHKNREYHRHNYEYSCKSLEMILRAAGFNPKVWSEDLFEDGFPGLIESLRKAGFSPDEVGDNLIAVGDKVDGVKDRYPVGLYV